MILCISTFPGKNNILQKSKKENKQKIKQKQQQEYKNKLWSFENTSYQKIAPYRNLFFKLFQRTTFPNITAEFLP